MLCNSDSRIAIGIRFQGFSGMVELESKLNRRLKLEGISIRIELKAKITRRNWNMRIELRPCGIGIGIYRFKPVIYIYMYLKWFSRSQSHFWRFNGVAKYKILHTSKMQFLTMVEISKIMLFFPMLAWKDQICSRSLWCFTSNKPALNLLTSSS